MPTNQEPLTSPLPHNHSSFTRFNELPREIRDMIYKETFHARVVHLVPLRGQGDESGWRERGPTGLYFKSKSPVPVLLHVSREARGVAASVYSKTFQTDEASPYTWLDYDLDTLYIDWEFSWFCLPRQIPIVFNPLREDAPRVKYLALGTDNRKGNWVTAGCLNLELCQVLSKFPRLQKLTVATPQHVLDPHNFDDLFPRTPTSMETQVRKLEESRGKWIQKEKCQKSVSSGNGGPPFSIPEIEMKTKLELLK